MSRKHDGLSIPALPGPVEEALKAESRRTGRGEIAVAVDILRTGLGLTSPERRPHAPTPRPDGSRRWRSTHVLAEASWTLTTAQRLATRLPRVMARLADLTPSGIPSSGGEAVSGGRYNDDGSVSGPVPSIALAWGDDDITANTRVLIVALARANDHLRAVEDALARISVMPDDRARKLVERVDADAGAPCADCGRWVYGTPQDRIKAGRCGACYLKRYRKERDTAA